MLHKTLIAALASFVSISLPLRAADDAKRHTENVIVVMLDGYRWQEFFTGADESYIDEKQGGVKDIAGTKSRYLKPTAAERRQAVMPFMWSTVAKRGQIFGNPARKAPTRSTNGFKFSYPGYNEVFCGFGDPRIDSNAKKNNPNLSVLEFLNEKPAFRHRVAAITTWDVFPFIFRSSANGLPVHAGWLPIKDGILTERQRQTNRLMEQAPRIWPDNVFDAFTMEASRAYIKFHSPRLVFIGLGETDEWGHGRRYDLYLDAARNADAFIAETWKTLQDQAQYKDKTTLLVTTDHGRGLTRADWTDHGQKVEGAEYIWIAVMGPDTPALGERENVETTQSQVAATIAKLLGEDFNAASPKSAEPLPVVGANQKR